MNTMMLDRPVPAPLDLEQLVSVKPDLHTLEENRVVAFDSQDARSRPFNIMRTKFTKQLDLQKMRMVGITSPAPAVGKSCISVNLAAALARLNDETIILVDLDFRRGSVSDILGLDCERGVTDYLSGKATSIEQVAVRIEGLPLIVIPTRETHEESSTLLSGERYEDLMAWLRAQSEHAIVLADLPPVFANDDAMLVMESLDSYLMVVDSSKTTVRQLKDAQDLLRPATSIGSVLNRYRGGALDSYGYGAGAAYSRYYKR